MVSGVSELLRVCFFFNLGSGEKVGEDSEEEEEETLFEELSELCE